MGGRLLIWLAGARREILAECPTDRAKYVGIGAAILITATMAGISLAFALVTALKAPLGVALPFAVAWGVAILCLDRLFVVSLPRQGRWWVHLLRALPRLLLALLLGFVISTPFVLQIFRPEIQHEITLLHTQSENAYLESVRSGHLQKEINQDTTNVSNLTAAAAGNGPVKTPAEDAQVSSLEKQRSQEQTQANTDYNKWQCQLYGTAPDGQTCHPKGDGQLAKADRSAYQGAQAQVQQLTKQIDTDEQTAQQERTSQLQHEETVAKAQLPAAQAAEAAAVSEQKQEIRAFTSQNDNNGGLLIRLQALGVLTANNTTLEAARWLLFALLVAIDCMPVIIKVMLNIGPENNYDRMLVAEEEKQLRVAASNRALRAAAERMAGETVIAEAQSRLDGWSAPLPGVTQNIIATRERVENGRVRSWENASNLRRVNGHSTVPLNPQPPIGFMAWPNTNGLATAPRLAPGQRLRNLWHWLSSFRLSWSHAPRHGQLPPQPPGQPYGAPRTPRPPGPLNGARRRTTQT